MLFHREQLNRIDPGEQGRTFLWHAEDPPHLECEYGSRSSDQKAERRYHCHDAMQAWFLNDDAMVGWSWEVLETRTGCSGGLRSSSFRDSDIGRPLGLDVGSTRLIYPNATLTAHLPTPS